MTRTEDGETITYTLGIGDRLASYGRADSMNPPLSGSYAYDAAGNVTRIERDGKPTLDLTWNSQYQLVSVATNGVFAESYTYDALSRRVSTTTLEGAMRHVYDDNWQCIADINEQGNVVASYVWGEGIDKLLAVTIGGATYYPLTDVQGTVWGYVDSQNNVVARWTYDAWGNVISEYVAPSAAALSKLRYRFQGRERSAATGLINFRMRWYDAETGRWLSKDPIGLSGGLNLYVFCGNSPLHFRDPFGLIIPPPIIGGIIGAIGGGIIGGTANYFDGGSFVAGFIGGAISGAISGATLGAIPFPGMIGGAAISAAVNAASSAIGSIITQGIDNKCIDWNEVGSSARSSAVAGAISGGFVGALGDLGGIPIKDKLLHGVFSGLLSLYSAVKY